MYDFTIYNYLKETVDLCKITNRKKETIIRCPYCGDSKNPHSTHLYILNLPPFKFYCQKCLQSGTAKTLLKDLQLYNPELSNFLSKEELKHQTKMNLKYGSSLRNIRRKGINFRIPNININDQYKMDYINNRLGTNYGLSDLDLIRYIPDLFKFFEINNIDLTKLDQFARNKLNLISKNHSIFMLADDNTLIARNMTNNGFRYVKVPIYSNINDVRSFYTFNKKIDMNKDCHTIHIAEGIYDIHGVKNVIDYNDNDIFIANNGKGYLSTLNYLLNRGISNCIINIYSDSEVSFNNFYKKSLRYSILAKYNGINIIYNEYGKGQGKTDFGVRKEEIVLSPPISYSFIKK